MKKILALFVLVVLLNLLNLAQDREIKSLSLEEVIEQALRNNLDLQIEMANPEISQALRDKSGAIFIPTLEINFNRGKTTNPSSSIFSGADVDTAKTTDLTLTLSQRLLLGGSLDVSLRNSRYETNSRYSSVNPRYNSTLTFSLTQPLLKSFGVSATKRNIHIAGNNQKKSIFALKQSVIDLIYQSEEAYWNLVYSHQNLEVKQKSLQLAKDFSSLPLPPPGRLHIGTFW